MTPARGTKVAAYVRVSTRTQEETGWGMDSERRQITEAAERNGWEVVKVFEEAKSANTTNGRKQLAAAIAMCERGEVAGLVVTKLHRLCLSVVDFATLLERAKKGGWVITVLDQNLDMLTPTGKLVAHFMA